MADEGLVCRELALLRADMHDSAHPASPSVTPSGVLHRRPSLAEGQRVNRPQQAGEVPHRLAVRDDLAEIADINLRGGAACVPFEVMHKPRCGREPPIAEGAADWLADMRPRAEMLLDLVTVAEATVALMAVEVVLSLVVVKEGLVPAWEVTEATKGLSVVVFFVLFQVRGRVEQLLALVTVMRGVAVERVLLQFLAAAEHPRTPLALVPVSSEVQLELRACELLLAALIALLPAVPVRLVVVQLPLLCKFFLANLALIVLVHLPVMGPPCRLGREAVRTPPTLVPVLLLLVIAKFPAGIPVMVTLGAVVLVVVVDVRFKFALGVEALVTLAAEPPVVLLPGVLLFRQRGPGPLAQLAEVCAVVLHPFVLLARRLGLEEARAAITLECWHDMPVGGAVPVSRAHAGREPLIASPARVLVGCWHGRE